MSEKFERMNNIAPIRHQHPKGLCYINNKVIFLPIPKNASTSLRNMDDFESRKANIMSFRKEIAEQEYRAFAIIRDPLSRFISGYVEVCKRASQDSPHILTKSFYWMNGKNRFIKFLDEIEEGWFDAHLFPQQYFLCDFEGRPFMIDAYVDVKQLPTALPVLLGKWGVQLPKAVPKLNVGDARPKGSTFKSRWHKVGSASHVRQGLYNVMDYAVRRLQRKPPPSSAEIQGYLREDDRLQSRVKELLADDMAFLEVLKRETANDEFGIFWRRKEP